MPEPVRPENICKENNSTKDLRAKKIHRKPQCSSLGCFNTKHEVHTLTLTVSALDLKKQKGVYRMDLISLYFLISYWEYNMDKWKLDVKVPTSHQILYVQRTNTSEFSKLLSSSLYSFFLDHSLQSVDVSYCILYSIGVIGSLKSVCVWLQSQRLSV